MAEAALQSALKGTVVRILRGKEADNTLGDDDTAIYFETMERTGEAQEAQNPSNSTPP